jgi:hypothetical protein
MLSNDKMRPNRFLNWHMARKRIAWIKAQLALGAKVRISTHLKSTIYSAKHADLFCATKTGAMVQQGRKLVCIDWCDIRAIHDLGIRA